MAMSRASRVPWTGTGKIAPNQRLTGWRALLDHVIKEVSACHLALPLTSTNIYETHKIRDPQRREYLARLQAVLSGGLVFRGRYRRLQAEIADVVRRTSGLAPDTREPLWFLSDIFFEAFAEWGDARLPPISERVVAYIQSQPAKCLYDYLARTPEDVRIMAVQKFSQGSDQLRRRIEDRRVRHAGESFAMRRRIYSALLMIDELELILGFARAAGAPWSELRDIGDVNARKLINDVPTYYIERELPIRLEDQKRAIDENDFRDMQSFCSALAYADQVIGENQFTNLARQAGLDKKYGIEVSSSIASLAMSLSR